MNATVCLEPYRIPAGILALVVHGFFFALLYFGVTWQKQAPTIMSVELWQSLPEIEPNAKPLPKPQPPPRIEPLVQPEPPKVAVKPEIAMPEKKKKPEPEPKPVEKKPVEKKISDPQPVAKPVSQPVASVTEQQAELAAATVRMVDEFTGKIAAKIHSIIVMPPDVPENARAEFRVTVLPGGSVLKAELRKSSGHTAYDNAVERAIIKADPLPLPPDPALFNKFRELNLGFQPKK